MREDPSWAKADRPRLGVSSCLLGEAVRYDGRHKLAPTLQQLFADSVEWVRVCPEVEAGLGVPREPIQLEIAPDGQTRAVGIETRLDVTSALLQAIRERVRSFGIHLLDGYVLKSRSPSCGLSVPRFRADGTPDAAPTRGLYAREILATWSSLPVIEEQSLDDFEQVIRFTRAILEHRDSRIESSESANAQFLASVRQRWHELARSREEE